LAELALAKGDCAATAALCQEELTTWRKLGMRDGMAASLHDLGRVAFELGDFPAARKLFEESLVIRRDLGDRPAIAYLLVALAPVAAALGGSLRTKYIEPSTYFGWPSTTERGWACFTAADCTAEWPYHKIAKTGRSMSLSTHCRRPARSNPIIETEESGRTRRAKRHSRRGNPRHWGGVRSR
jgi:hypothetical protein